ncbi:MAG: right-handed parallel beta-helix repeat-containing protein [Candidatus Eisenbacteria bacterium]
MPVELDNCIFSGNTATGDGGAVSGGSGYPRITNCLFENNSANRGGAIALAYSDQWIDRCTFTGNRAVDGGAVFIRSASACTLVSCTFADNEADRGSGITLVTTTSTPAVFAANLLAFGNVGEGFYWDGEGSIELSDNDVYGNEGGDWVGWIAGLEGQDGNVSADPLFCDLEGGDLTLMDLSPCLPENNPRGVLIGAHGKGCATPTAVTPGIPGPPGAIVLGNHPNPFNPRTTITFRLVEESRVVLAVHDLAGRRVAALTDRRYGPGAWTVEWNGIDGQGRSVPSGTYFLLLTAEGGTFSRKISLIR